MCEPERIPFIEFDMRYVPKQHKKHGGVKLPHKARVKVKPFSETWDDWAENEKEKRAKCLIGHKTARACVFHSKVPVLCYYCDCVLNGLNASFDHIVPTSRGGSKTKASGNIVLACKLCNREKGDSVDFERWCKGSNKKPANPFEFKD